MNLRAAQSGLRSNGELILSKAPNFQDNERQTEAVGGSFSFDRQRFLDLQTDLFVNQPITLTDGTLTLVGSLQRFQQFNTLGDVTGVDLPPGAPTTNERIDYAPQMRLQFIQPLFTMNRLRTNFRKAELNLEKTVQTYTRSQLDIVHNVTTNFYSLFRSQQQVAIDSAQVGQSENAFRIANLKQQAGLLPEVEVLRLEVDLENARNQLVSSEVTMQQTEDAFKVLIGVRIEESIQVTTLLSYEPLDITLEKALREALRRRTELRTDEIDMELNTITVKETDAARELKGELNFSYGIFKRDERFFDAFTDFDQDRRVTFSLTVPLWDWSKNDYEVQAAEANLENTRLLKRNRVETIKQEIRNAVRSLKSAEQRVNITKRSEDLAAKSYRISLLKFESGDLSTQDLALEQNRLTQAKVNSLNAIIDYKQALSDLRRKTLWDFEANGPVQVEVPEEDK
jgi:outer membrane protein TolC